MHEGLRKCVRNLAHSPGHLTQGLPAGRGDAGDLLALPEPCSADLDFNFFALIGPSRLMGVCRNGCVAPLSNGSTGLRCRIRDARHLVRVRLIRRAPLYAILNLGTATAITLALEDGN